MNFIERLENYSQNHCWQYDVRLNNLEEDKILFYNKFGFDYNLITTNDFSYKPLLTKEEKIKAKEFIERYEWLGNLTQYSTHYFGAYYQDELGGIIIFSMPNAFSKLLGENTKNIERLISRGACASWTPKSLASQFLMWCIKWMVKNTQYRLFTAYSDPSAKELGTIYQACNFYYLGNNNGTTTRYINPYTGKLVSDRFFRQRTAYKKYAKELGIIWQKEWTTANGIAWKNMPNEIEKILRQYSKDKQNNAEKIIFPSKHKYAYVLGASKLETKRLRKQFEERNKILPYPKERGQ